MPNSQSLAIDYVMTSMWRHLTEFTIYEYYLTWSSNYVVMLWHRAFLHACSMPLKVDGNTLVVKLLLMQGKQSISKKEYACMHAESAFKGSCPTAKVLPSTTWWHPCADIWLNSQFTNIILLEVAIMLWHRAFLHACNMPLCVWEHFCSEIAAYAR